MFRRVGFVVGRLFRCYVRLLRLLLLLLWLFCLLFLVFCRCVFFSSLFRCSGLRETLEAIPAQSAERGRGARLFVNCVLAAALPGQRGRFSGRKRSVKKDLKDTASTRAKRSQRQTPGEAA